MRSLLPYVLIFAAALVLPFIANDYWAVIGARAAVYWVLVAGLNLVVGYGGQLAIGWVALLTLGSYTASILVARFNLDPFLAYAAGGVIGALAGVVVGLPALRLRTFYFAMTTLGFATIVTQVALAWQSVTGGGIGLPGPALNAPFDSAWGFYLLCLGLAAIVTWMTANIGVHHVHHLYSKIPFYKLHRVMRDHPELADIRRLTLRESLGCVSFTLWDQKARRLVSFREVRAPSC